MAQIGPFSLAFSKYSNRKLVHSAPLLPTITTLESFVGFSWVGGAMVSLAGRGVGVNPKCCIRWVKSGRESFFPLSVPLPS